MQLVPKATSTIIFYNVQRFQHLVMQMRIDHDHPRCAFSYLHYNSDDGALLYRPLISGELPAADPVEEEGVSTCTRWNVFANPRGSVEASPDLAVPGAGEAVYVEARNQHLRCLTVIQQPIYHVR